MRVRVLGDDEEPGRIAIEPVDDAGTLLLAARDAVPEKAVNESTASVPGRRMDDHPGRLVDDEEVLILVGDREPEFLRLELRRRGRRPLDDERLAACEPVALCPPNSVDEHTALAQEALGL
jgi:hypothetical protein